MATAGALPGNSPACTDDTYSGGNGTFGGVSPAGWLGGVQGGYNWQGIGSPLVLGVETDVQATVFRGEGSDAGGDSFQSDLRALGTVRARAGYAMDRALVYATGGLAWGAIHNEAALANGTDFNVSQLSTTGYVLGGGLEYKVKRDLSVKVEYQYVNLGKNDRPTRHRLLRKRWHGSRRCVQHRARGRELFPVRRA